MPDDGEAYDPDVERVQEAAVDRQHERTETVEDMLGDIGIFEEEKYPVSSEELAVKYGDEIMDLPNESESLGSVFDRLVDERFESPEELREVIYDEVTGQAAGAEEYNAHRDLSALDDDDAQME